MKKDLPQIVPRVNLRHYWWYKNETGAMIALVVRYDDPNQKNFSSVSIK